MPDGLSEIALDERYIAKVATNAENGLLHALKWMPYPSDIEDAAARKKLARALDEVDIALSWVREARAEAERRIVARAVTE